MSYSIYHELQSSTAVTGAVQASLTSSTSRELVVSRGSVVEVYTIPTSETVSANENAGVFTHGKYLNLLCSLNLYGVVLSLRSLRPNQTIAARNGIAPNTDVLLVSFTVAKVVVLAYDATTLSLRTLEIYNFEEASTGPGAIAGSHAQTKGRETNTGFGSLAKLVVDPQHRCAAMMVYEDQLVILPVSNNVYTSGVDGLAHSTGRYPILDTPYVISLKKDLSIAGTVKDISFLGGYLQPTLLVLHDPRDGWIGSLAYHPHPCVISAITIDINQKKPSRIWNIEGLPVDATQLQRVAAPYGGVLVFTTNAILYYNQKHYCGLAVNGYASSTVNTSLFPLQSPSSPLSIKLDGCTAVFLTPTDLLLSLRSEELFLLKLTIDNTQTVKGIELIYLGNCVRASCAVNLGSRFFFIGSSVGDSILAQYSRITAGKSSYSAVGRGQDGDDNLLYEGTGGNEGTDGQDARVKNFDFNVLDSITNIGPITDSCVGHVPLGEEEDEPAPDSNKCRDRDMIMCSGYGRQGNLCLVTRGMRGDVLTEFEVPDVEGMWSLSSPCVDENEVEGLMSSYLLLSLKDKTMILHTAEGMEEISDREVGFYTGGPTLYAGNVFNNKRSFQVYGEGVRLMEGENNTQEMPLRCPIEDGGIGGNATVSITSVTVSDPYICLALSDRSIRLLSADSSDMQLAVVNIDDALTSLNIKPNTITACSVFCDAADKLTALIKGVDSTAVGGAVSITAASINNNEEEELYKATGSSLTMNSSSTMLGGDDDIYGTSTSMKPASTATGKGMSLDDEDALYGTSTGATATADTMAIDDDDDDALYGSSTAKSVPAVSSASAVDDGNKGGMDIDNGEDANPSAPAPEEDCLNPVYYLAVSHVGGRLDILTLPEMKHVFSSNGLCNGTPLLENNLLSDVPRPDSALLKNGRYVHPYMGKFDLYGAEDDGADRYVTQLTITHVGNRKNPLKLLLAAHMSDGDILLYWPREIPRFGWTKISHEMITRSSSSKVCNVPFSNIGGLSGLYFGGEAPFWVLPYRESYTIMSHSLNGDRDPTLISVSGFTEFHNEQLGISNAFIYTHTNGAVRVCSLPTDVSVNSNSDFIIRKVPLGATPFKISYLGPECRPPAATKPPVPTYAVLVSVPTPASEITAAAEAMKLSEGGAEEEEEEEEEVGPGGRRRFRRGPTAPYCAVPVDHPAGVPVPMGDAFELRLIQAGAWTTINCVRLNPYEHGLCMQVMYLSPSDMEDPRHYVIVGTGTVNSNGEDDQCKGRILMYEIKHVNTPDPNDPETIIVSAVLKLVYSEEFPAPVTAVIQVNQFVLHSVGTQILMYEWNGEKLAQKSMFNAQTFIVNIDVASGGSRGDIILVSDVMSSVQLLLWKPEDKNFYVLGKDPYPREVQSASIIKHYEGAMGLLVSDEQSNLSILNFKPHHIDSKNGLNLIQTADFHLGDRVPVMMRLKLIMSSGVSAAYFGTLLGTTRGAIGALLPIEEFAFMRLYTLQSVLMNALPHTASLNPESFRTYKSKYRTLRTRKKNIIDGCLLFRFLSLPWTLQIELARNIGTTPDNVIKNLRTVRENTRSF